MNEEERALTTRDVLQRMADARGQELDRAVDQIEALTAERDQLLEELRVAHEVGDWCAAERDRLQAVVAATASAMGTILTHLADGLSVETRRLVVDIFDAVNEVAPLDASGETPVAELSESVEILERVAANFVDKLPIRGVLAVAEEAGEFVGAYRRWIGEARRSGTFAEVEDELADVILAAWSTAVSLHMDLPAVLVRKGRVVLDRIAEETGRG